MARVKTTVSDVDISERSLDINMSSLKLNVSLVQREVGHTSEVPGRD